jgi:hypothetical protein
MKSSPVGTAGSYLEAVPEHFPPQNIRRFPDPITFQPSLRDSSRPPANPGLRPGLSSASPVQIGFERCLGSATTLSLQRPSPCCHPERSRGTCGAPEPQTKALRVNSRIYPKRFVPHPPDRSLETTNFSTGLLLAPTPGVANCGQPRSQATKVLGKTCELTRGGFCLGFRRTAGLSASLGMTTRRGSLQGEGGC